MKRDLLALADLDRAGLLALLERSEEHARDRAEGRRWPRRDPSGSLEPRPLAGRTVAILLEKPSTRTRLALEVATVELGGHPLVMTAAGSQMERGEPVADTARVLGRTVDAVAYRAGAEARLEAMARACRAPVVNALSDEAHPLQVLADLHAVRAERGRLEGLRYAFVGSASNVARSWIEAAGLLGLELTLACPTPLGPPAALVEAARAKGASVTVVTSPEVAVRRADVVITDTWVSMGEEARADELRRLLAPYQVTRLLLAHAAPEVVVLHCMPAHRGEEIEAEVLDGPRSLVWEAVGARLHTAKAVLAWVLEPRRDPPSRSLEPSLEARP